MTTIIRSDQEIIALRAARDAALNTPEMRAQRAEIHRLYGEACEAGRRAASYRRHYGRTVEPVQDLTTIRSEAGAAAYARADRHATKAAQVCREADDHERQCMVAHLTADAAYHKGTRVDALRAAGLIGPDGVEIQIGRTSAERASDDAFERRRLDLPPVGWGLVRWPDVADRIAAWQARPALERRSDPRERIANP